MFQNKTHRERRRERERSDVINWETVRALRMSIVSFYNWLAIYLNLFIFDFVWYCSEWKPTGNSFSVKRIGRLTKFGRKKKKKRTKSTLICHSDIKDCKKYYRNHDNDLSLSLPVSDLSFAFLSLLEFRISSLSLSLSLCLSRSAQ